MRASGRFREDLDLRLKPLPEPKDYEVQPDYETLHQLICEYRSFVGNEAAFHIEYFYWPGEFDTKDEEMDFFLIPEMTTPDPYEVLKRHYDDLSAEAAADHVNLIDAKGELRIFKWIAAMLAMPYFVLLYLWSQ